MQTAIFVDAENMLQWLKQKGPEQLVKELHDNDPIIIRKAYGAWNKPELSIHQKYLTEQGFDLEHHFHPVKGKNSADIHLVVDVMKYAYTRPEIEHFVIVSQDSDFSMVFRVLRNLGKRVTAVTYPSVLSTTVRNSCHRVIELAATQKNTTPKTVSKKTVSKKLQEKIINAVLKEGGACQASILKVRLLEENQNFSEKQYGFSSFGQFLLHVDGLQCMYKESTLSIKIRESIDSATVTSVRQEIPSDSLEDRYWQQLKKKNWYPVPKEILLQTYDTACIQGPLSRQAHKNGVMLLRGFEKKLVNNTFALLFKARLFSLHTESPERLFVCHQRNNIFPDVDYLTVAGLFRRNR